MEIYEICKENREKLGLTIDEFSHSINIDSKCYEKFEKGEYVFSKDIMKVIFSCLYVEKEDFEILDFTNDEITNISLKVIRECEKGE